VEPKYSEKTYPSVILFNINPTWLNEGSNPGRRGGKWLTAWSMAQLQEWPISTKLNTIYQICLVSVKQILFSDYIFCKWTLDKSYFHIINYLCILFKNIQNNIKISIGENTNTEILHLTIFKIIRWEVI
jgi:hypothetical protein